MPATSLQPQLLHVQPGDGASLALEDGAERDVSQRAVPELPGGEGG